MFAEVLLAAPQEDLLEELVVSCCLAILRLMSFQILRESWVTEIELLNQARVSSNRRQ
jgi:hypothetical protein